MSVSLAGGFHVLPSPWCLPLYHPGASLESARLRSFLTQARVTALLLEALPGSGPKLQSTPHARRGTGDRPSQPAAPVYTAWALTIWLLPR